jgi:hypothetical protein
MPVLGGAITRTLVANLEDTAQIVRR